MKEKSEKINIYISVILYNVDMQIFIKYQQHTAEIILKK